MARRWASGRGGSSRPEDAGDAATAAMLRARRAALGEDDAIEIGAGEASAVHLFFALNTQWRRAGLAGIRVGLDYTAIVPTAALLDIPTSPALFADIQLMEREALEAFAR